MNQHHTRADFLAFYRKNVRVLHAYFRRLGVSRPEQIDDLVQESFVEAYRSWDSLNSQSAAQAWLYTIGRRQLAKLIQKDRFLHLSPSEDVALRDEQSSDPTPESEVHAQRLCQTVLQLIVATDKARVKQVLIAYYLEEKSFREIQAETGINLSTLTTWCSRFRKDCVEALDKQQKTRTVAYLNARLLLKKGTKL